jgi:hypothetical protein
MMVMRMQEEELLAAFLADPLASNPRWRYRTWLEERGLRGEYLRLLLNELVEPASPCPGGAVRERLRQLRGQIANDWAERVDQTRLITEGVYQSIPCPEGWHYLRFCPDGTVLAGCSTEPPEEVWRRLTSANDLGGFCRSSYTLRADELRFSLPYQPSSDLLRQWQTLKEKLCSSWKPSDDLLREWEALQQVPRDRSCGPELDREIDRLERQMDVGAYQAELEAKMNRLAWSGALGPQTLCLQWQSAFDDSYSGVTTYWLALATGTARRLVGQPSEKPGQKVPIVGPEKPPTS